MSNLWAARGVVLSDKAAAAIDAATKAHNRFDDAWIGLEWLLIRNPDIGAVADVDGTNWWVYVEPSDPVAKTPIIWVVYQVTQNQILIEAVNVQSPN